MSRKTLAACVVAVLLLLSAGGAQAMPMHEYNLIVFGDSDWGSNMEGRAFIGGDVKRTSDYGTRLTGAEYSGIDVLTVGGDIAGGVNVNFNSPGDVRVGGQVLGNVNLNGAGSQLINDPSVDITPIQDELLSLSGAYSGMAANSYIAQESNNVVFHAAANADLAVFNVDGNALWESGNVNELKLELNGAENVLINVSGGSLGLDINFGNAWKNEDVSSLVLWNFYEAADIDNSRQHWGSVLAPHAEFDMSSSIEGSLAVAALKGAAQIHLPMYAGDDIPVPSPSHVPVPAAVWLLGSGLLVLAGLRKRRSF